MTRTSRAALDLRRPFTRPQALAAGLTDAELRSSRFQRLHLGVYILAEVAVTPALRAEAALLTAPDGSFVSHATAGRLWRVPLPVLPDEHVTVAERAARRQRAGVRCHHLPAGQEPVSGRDVVLVAGVPTSSACRLFAELASDLPLVDLVVVGDHLVRHGLVSLADLRSYVAVWSGRRAAHARAAVAFVRERVDSPMETRLRMLIVLAGLPEPEVNVTYSDDHGLTRRKYDLSWPEVRLIVEYDGRQHVERVEQWESDLGRREAIDDTGWRMVVVVASGIYRTPEQTLAKIHRLLLERGMPGTPRRLRDGWRPHFPGRN